MKSIPAISIAILLVCSAAMSGHGQTFEMKLSLGGTSEEAVAALELPSGNTVVAGYGFYGSDFDITLTELTDSGSVVNGVKATIPNNQIAKSIVRLDDGSFIVVGSSFVTASAYDGLIVKFDAALNPLWYKVIGDNGGNDYLNSCFLISPGKIMVSGTIGLGGSAKPSVLMIDTAGNILQEYYLTTNQFASPNYRARYFNDGTLGMCNLANDITVMDTTGSITVQGNNNFSTYTRDVMKTPGGKYLMIGTGNIGGPTGSKLCFALADQTVSVYSYATSYAQNGYDLEAAMMALAPNGDYILAANQVSQGNGNETPLFFRIDSTGTLLNPKMMLPVNSTSCHVNSILPISGNRYIITGKVFSSGQSMFVALIDTSLISCSSTLHNPFIQTITAVSRTPHSPFIGNVNQLTNGTPLLNTPAAVPATNCLPTGLVFQTISGINISVAPNPFTHQLQIDAGSGRAVMYFSLFDLAGRLIRSNQFDGKININTADLPSGSYFLRIVNAEGIEILSKKLVKGD